MHIGSHPKQGPLQSRRMKWLWDKIQGKHLQLLQGCFPRPSSLLNTRPSFCLSLAILTLSSHLCSQCSKYLLENIVFSLWGKNMQWSTRQPLLSRPHQWSNLRRNEFALFSSGTSQMCPRHHRKIKEAGKATIGSGEGTCRKCTPKHRCSRDTITNSAGKLGEQGRHLHTQDSAKEFGPQTDGPKGAQHMQWVLGWSTFRVPHFFCYATLGVLAERSPPCYGCRTDGVQN